MKKQKQARRPVPRFAPHREALTEAFFLDDEAASMAAELIEGVTSAEFVGEEARNESFDEETTPAYEVDFTAFVDGDDYDQPALR